MKNRTCSVDGCGEPHNARGFCPKHYARWKRLGSPTADVREYRPGDECSIDGCPRPARKRGWCQTHYSRWYAHGSVDDPTPWDSERFWDRVELPEGCWEWTGGINSSGYGSFSKHGVSAPAHRYAYEMFVGPIPDGLELDHLCRNRRCVNPMHLEPVTRAENARRQPDNAGQFPRRS